MVLLKHHLCWDYEDLASLRLNSHIEKTKSKIDDNAKEKLKEWLKTSYLFYDHFRVNLFSNYVCKYVRKKETRL